MKKKDLYYNYIGQQQEKEIVQALNDGYAVNVGSSCIGHTRAQMVNDNAKRIFQTAGAKLAFTEYTPYGSFHYYML